MRAIICLLLGIYLLSPRASATVETWQIIGEPSRVAINFSANHDYYPRTWPYAFRAHAAALEAVRRDLVLKGKLQDEPIVVRLPGAVFNGTSTETRLSLKTVALQRGDGEELSSHRRYVIEWNDAKWPAPDTPEFFADLLALTLHLPELNAQNTTLEIKNFSNLRSEYARQIAHYQKLMQHFDPIWSPSGTHLIFCVWQNGRLDFWLLEPTQRKLWKLESLPGVAAQRPAWSRAGQYLAYADLRSVKVLQLANAQTHDFTWPQNKANPNYETLLQFHQSADHQERLLVGFDTNLFNSYVISDLELPSLESTRGTVAPARPKWAENSATQARLFETRRAVSPTGEWTASIEAMRGVRRLVLRSRAGKNHFRVADLPAQNVTDSPDISLIPPATQPPEIKQNASVVANRRNRIAIAMATGLILVALLSFVWRIFQRSA